jgi:hypothetical protein
MVTERTALKIFPLSPVSSRRYSVTVHGITTLFTAAAWDEAAELGAASVLLWA